MPQQPDLFSSSTEGPAALTPGHGSKPVKPAAVKRTAGQKVGRLLMAAEFPACHHGPHFHRRHRLRYSVVAAVGQQSFLTGFSCPCAVLSYGAVRGVISGFGLLNLWVAVDDTLHRSQRHT